MSKYGAARSTEPPQALDSRRTQDLQGTGKGHSRRRGTPAQGSPSSARRAAESAHLGGRWEPQLRSWLLRTAGGREGSRAEDRASPTPSAPPPRQLARQAVPQGHTGLHCSLLFLPADYPLIDKEGMSKTTSNYLLVSIKSHHLSILKYKIVKICTLTIPPCHSLTY